MKTRSLPLVVDGERLAETLLEQAAQAFVVDRGYASDATRRQAWKPCTALRAAQPTLKEPVKVRKAGR